MQQYWEQHPFQYQVFQITREGQWVTHVFEWIFMMISRFTGYLMTLSIGYLIYYVIEFKHALDAIPLNPTFPDQLASFSNVVINVGPELVFPGVVVFCIRAFTARRWLDGALYLVITIVFVILTMVLLNAFMGGQITKDFLSTMLFWRAAASLSYTVVVAYCGGHGGLDFRSLLNELDGLRGQLDGGQQTVSSLREQLSGVQQRASTLQEQLESGQREVVRLRRDLDTEQKRVSALQAELETGTGDSAALRRDLTAVQVEAETVRMQLEGKQRELAGLREVLESGQEWQESRFRQLLEVEQQRALSLQEQLTAEEASAAALRRQLNSVLGDVDGLRKQLEAKQREVEEIQATLDGEQQRASTLRQRLDSGQSVQASSGQGKVESGHGKTVDGGQGKVVRLDSRSRRSGQGDATENAIAEQIRTLLAAEPGLSGRGIAARLGCSPTTAAKWKQFFENGGQTSAECVNE